MRDALVIRVTCPTTRKVAYASRHDAKRWAKHHRHTFSTPAMRTYRCQFCGAWHLTKQERR